MPDNQRDFVCSTSYADVYRISYRNTEALIFSFHPHIARCVEFQKGLHRSMTLHQNFHHPNKMEVYAWNREFIITERANPWDMNKLSFYERLSHKKQLISLCTLAHARDLYHGSLHPEFIFTREDRSLAVMGWRFSQHSLPMIHQYRPPERYHKRGNKASDQYAMAIFMYEFLAKSKPWESRCTPYEIQMRKEKPLLRPLTAFGFSHSKNNIFMKALSNNPSERFPSLEAFVRECPEEHKTSLVEQETPTVGRFYKTQKEPRYGHNRQNTALFCVAVLLAVFIGFYEQSARAGGASWKSGFGMREGSTLMDGEELGIKMIDIPSESLTGSQFSISETEITRKQWSFVMNRDLSSSSTPKTNITWLDAIQFCNTLSLRSNKEAVYTIHDDHVAIDSTKNGYRLPTVQEWEHAARGDKKERYAASDDLGSIAWTSRNTKGSVQKVKTKNPNSFGLYDMTGNAAEWVTQECFNNTCLLDDLGATKGGSVRSLQREYKTFVTAPMNRLSRDKDIGFRIVAP